MRARSITYRKDRHCEGTPEAIQIDPGLLWEYPRNDELRKIHGFTLVEVLIAMFILTLMTTVVLKHQIFLLEMQKELEERSFNERQEHKALFPRI